jgi:hypothetical protein
MRDRRNNGWPDPASETPTQGPARRVSRAGWHLCDWNGEPFILVQTGSGKAASVLERHVFPRGCDRYSAGNEGVRRDSPGSGGRSPQPECSFPRSPEVARRGALCPSLPVMPRYVGAG